MTESWDITWWEYTGRYQDLGEGASHPIMRNIVTNDECIGRDLPFGACFDANVNPETLEVTDYYRTGSDGKAIMCIVPYTDPASPDKRNWWYIDERASNCDKKGDDKHRCWVRHGSVGDLLHTDKDGLTCGAGAGSIQNSGWHGFLHKGKLYKA